MEMFSVKLSVFLWLVAVPEGRKYVLHFRRYQVGFVLCPFRLCRRWDRVVRMQQWKGQRHHLQSWVRPWHWNWDLHSLFLSSLCSHLSRSEESGRTTERLVMGAAGCAQEISLLRVLWRPSVKAEDWPPSSAVGPLFCGFYFINK